MLFNELIYNDSQNKSLNNSYFIYCLAHYSLTDGDEVSLVSGLTSVAHRAQ